jgi:hypothetical protein
MSFKLKAIICAQTGIATDVADPSIRMHAVDG